MQDNRTFEFWWTPTYEDWWEANKVYRRITRAYLGELRWIAVCLLLFAMSMWPEDDGDLRFIAIICTAFFVLDLLVLRRQRAKRYWRQNAAMHDAVHGIVHGSEGVTTVDSTSTRSIRWHGIERVEETERQFVLFFTGMNSRSWQELPKSAVHDDATIDELRVLLRERVGATAFS